MSYKNKKIIAIIPAAGKSTNRIVENPNLPDTMVPINGKPIIGYIIEDLLSRKINDIIVVLGSEDTYTEKYINRKFNSKCSLHVMYNNKSERGVGYSIYLATQKYTDKKNSFLVNLGDTLYKGALDFTEDFLVVEKEYDSSKKWCFVEKKLDKLKFIDKPDTYSGGGKILCGLYFFKDNVLLKENLQKLTIEKNKIEMIDILTKYSLSEKFKLIDSEKWYDCGNIENYYKAKFDFLKVREFNKLSYNELYGYITKESVDNDKIFKEINWFLNMPSELKIFSPRLVDYSTTKEKTSYSLEFYGYQSLADLFLFGSLDLKIWDIIMKQLFKIVNLFRAYKTKLPYSVYYEMYKNKTCARLNDLKQNEYWKKLINKPTLKINGKSYKNINSFFNNWDDILKKLYKEKDMSFIHGDLCLSNILFDPSSRIFKFIDPRGSFGQVSVYGDLKYDIAKLRHSFVGYYDFIVSDMFKVEEKNTGFILEFYNDDYHDSVGRNFDRMIIENDFDITEIKLIEALLFLSMIPLHRDNFDRQKAMYLTGVKLLNELKI